MPILKMKTTLTPQQEIRKQRGLHIAKTSIITHTEKGWKVPSQSGMGYYIVKTKIGQTKCNCQDFETRGEKCKHIWAVHLTVTKEIDSEGNVTITKTVRKTYPQDWKNYNLAQQKEKELIMKLLSDLTRNIKQEEIKLGRRKNPLSDIIYSMIFKVYSTFSGRRFSTDIQTAKDKGLVDKKISYNSMFDYFKKGELTPILSNLVILTSLPLKGVEVDFAIDSTGFGTSVFQRWFSFKFGKEISSRRWVKCHFVTGTKTNIISSVKVTSEFDNDCPELAELFKDTKKNFDMKELSADKAYLSRDNLELIEGSDTRALIPFKSNSLPNKNGDVWRKLFHFFSYKKDEFLQSYHKRSNGETTGQMIKSKFGDCVRSKVWNAQVNEVLCKVICHNLSCVIMEMFCLGIEPDFK